MKKVFVAVVVLSVLAIAFVLHGQSVGSGSFSGTLGTTPLSGTFTLSVVDQCSGASNAKSSAALPPSSGPAETVAGVTGKAIYVCGFVLGNESGANKFSYGTTTQCLSQTGTTLSGNILAAGQGPVVVGNTNQTILTVPSGNSLCFDGGAQGFVTYVQK